MVAMVVVQKVALGEGRALGSSAFSTTTIALAGAPKKSQKGVYCVKTVI